MKKFILISISLFIFSGLTMAMSIYDENAWIGAHSIKNMSTSDNFYPYVDIRHNNYSYSNDGSIIRTIMSDYILIQELPITKKINTLIQDWNGAINIDNLITGIDRLTFEQYIIQYKTLLLLKNEISNKIKSLKLLLGTTNYEKFSYRFFHFQILKFETSVIDDDNDIYALKNDDTVEMRNLKMSLRGVLLDKEISIDGELKDSVLNLNYINSMIPAYPEKLCNQINQPLFSTNIILMEPQEKKMIITQLGNQTKFGYVQKVMLITTLVNNEYLNGINIHLQTFTSSHLDQLQLRYKNLYGADFNISNITLANLTSILRTIIKI